MLVHTHLFVFDCLLGLLLLITQAGGAVYSDENHVVDQYSLSRQKRSSSNYDLVEAHTICQKKSAEATETGVSDADKKLIVDMHNAFRSNPNPPASNMLKMMWDDEVALIAQKWAEHCDMTHDENKARSIPGRFGVGQNLAMGTSNFKHAIELWQSENATFVYNGTNNLLSIGHYTQVNWADTNIVGCGFAKCGSKNYHVCNYATPGNVAGRLGTPYESGAPCSACPGRCVDGKLCDCGITCWNGAELDRSTCTCKCLNDKYIAPSCKLDCEREDPSTGGYSCEGSFGQNDCSSIKRYCPTKCGFCPAADYRVVEKAIASCLNNGVRGISATLDTFAFINVIFVTFIVISAN